MKKILVLKTDGIGDAILATPFLFELRKIFKNDIIIGILSKEGKEVLEDLRIFNEIIVFEALWLKYEKIFFLKRWLSALKLLFLINKIKPDIVFGLRWQDRITSLILSLCNAKIKVGYDVKGMGFNIDKKVENENIHVIYKNLNLLKVFFPNRKFKIKLGFSINNKAKIRIERFLKKNKLKKYIIFHPVSGHSSKDWNIKNYEILAKKLSDRYKIIVIGAEKDRIESIKGENIINTKGLFNIKEIGYLIKKAFFVIGGDSAAVHIAAVFKKKTLTLFSGAARYENWAAFNRNNFILTKEVPCKGCELIYCNKNNECMNFTPDFVYNLIIKIITNKQKQKIIKV